MPDSAIYFDEIHAAALAAGRPGTLENTGGEIMIYLIKGTLRDVGIDAETIVAYDSANDDEPQAVWDSIPDGNTPAQTVAAALELLAEQERAAGGLTYAAQRALEALRVLNPTADQAAFLLESWSGRRELADADVTAVLAAYAAALRLTVSSNRMDLCDSTGELVAVARRATGPGDIWIVRAQGDSGAPLFVTGEMAARAALLVVEA